MFSLIKMLLNRSGKQALRRQPRADLAKKHARKPKLETLEDRLTPSTFQLTATNYFVSETGPTVQITVTRSGDTTSPASVDYATKDESAIAGINYTNPGVVTLNFIANQTQASFLITILNDGVVHGNTVFGVGLSNPSSGDSINPSFDGASVTITEANGNKGQRIVADYYLELFHRQVDASGLASWSSLLNSGKLTTYGLVASLQGFQEYRATQINALAQQLLGSNISNSDLQLYSQQLAAGASVMVVEQNIIASAAYYANAGGTNSLFVEQGYRDAVNTNPSSSDEQGWLTAFQNGTATRNSFANTLVFNTTGRVLLINLLYQQYFNHPASGNFQPYVNALASTQASTGYQWVQQQLLGNPNYTNSI